MLAFHATLHRRPLDHQSPHRQSRGLPPGSEIEERDALVLLAGQPYATIDWSAEAASVGFDCTFEAAAQSLAALDGMFCEPDGSFVWTSRPGEPRWQIDGVLYDRHDRLLFVEIKGTCPPTRFDDLLRAFGWPDVAVVMQINQAAVFLEEAEFRRYAAASGS